MFVFLTCDCMEFSTKSGSFDACAKIIKTEGLSGIYKVLETTISTIQVILSAIFRDTVQRLALLVHFLRFIFCFMRK